MLFRAAAMGGDGTTRRANARWSRRERFRQASAPNRSLAVLELFGLADDLDAIAPGKKN